MSLLPYYRYTALCYDLSFLFYPNLSSVAVAKQSDVLFCHALSSQIVRHLTLYRAE